jgi:hypothetical protein
VVLGTDTPSSLRTAQNRFVLNEQIVDQLRHKRLDQYTCVAVSTPDTAYFPHKDMGQDTGSDRAGRLSDTAFGFLDGLQVLKMIPL